MFNLLKLKTVPPSLKPQLSWNLFTVVHTVPKVIWFFHENWACHTAGAETTVYVWFLGLIDVNKSGTNTIPWVRQILIILDTVIHFFRHSNQKSYMAFQEFFFLVWKILEYMTMVLPLQKEISVCCRASVSVGAVCKIRDLIQENS